MITIFKGKSGELDTISGLMPDVWVDVVAPSPDEIASLEQQLRIPHVFLVAALDTDERARTDREDDAQLILWRTPYFLGQTNDIPLITIPLGIVLLENTIVTICREKNEVIQDILAGRGLSWSTAERNRLLLYLMLRTAGKYLQYLRQINQETDALEDALQHSMKNHELLELLQRQKSLVYFATALKSNELMIERLRKSGLFERYSSDQELVEDVLTENQQAIEMVGISSDILSQMMDAFASIISNNLNVVMKFLTSATIILTVPTLVASFYGMNVGLPLQDSPYAFLFTLALSLGLSLLLVLVFLKNDWF